PPPYRRSPSGLSANAGAGAEGALEEMAAAVDLSGRLILVVEDDYFLASDTARALRAAGAQVIGPCPTEAAAESMIAAERPSAAIMDINLGDGPSFRLASALKEQGIPFVFMTGYDGDMIPPDFSDVQRLEKPVDLRCMVDAVAQAVGAA